MRKIVLSFVFIVLLAYSYSGWSDDAKGIGYVSAVRGKVIAISGEGVARLLETETPVFLDDIINTEKRSRIQIILHDNTVLTLGQKSTLRITDFQWSETQEGGELNMKISEGIFRVIGGAIAKSSPKKFIAETPAATIGIRGSSYAGMVDGSALTVALESGKGIDVFNDAGSVALLVPGMGTVVEDMVSRPTEARLFSTSEMSIVLDGLGLDASDGGPGSILGPNAVIINKSRIHDSVNIAVGKNNTANMGSVVIKGSKVDAAVVNENEIKDSSNVAVGTENEANMGAVVIE